MPLDWEHEPRKRGLNGVCAYTGCLKGIEGAVLVQARKKTPSARTGKTIASKYRSLCKEHAEGLFNEVEMLIIERTKGES